MKKPYKLLYTVHIKLSKDSAWKRLSTYRNQYDAIKKFSQLIAEGMHFSVKLEYSN